MTTIVIAFAIPITIIITCIAIWLYYKESNIVALAKNCSVTLPRGFKFCCDDALRLLQALQDKFPVINSLAPIRHLAVECEVIPGGSPLRAIKLEKVKIIVERDNGSLEIEIGIAPSGLKRDQISRLETKNIIRRVISSINDLESVI